jgi:class 3 adenylate cyclase
MLRARIDRHRCIGAGNCLTLAPTAFDWVADDLFKAEVVDPDSVEAEVLRAAALSCPTEAIVIEEIDELLPWQLRRKAGSTRRVVKTFMFTDIVNSTSLVEAVGDEAWTNLLRWHDETMRALFAAHRGQEVTATGDGFFVGFDSPEAAIACAVAIQRKLDEHRRHHGFAPQVRIGLHASEAAQVGSNYHGVGVHEAARSGALAGAGEIVASRATVSASTSQPVSAPRRVALKGIAEEVEVVDVDWR